VLGGHRRLHLFGSAEFLRRSTELGTAHTLIAGGQKPTIPELAELLKNDEPAGSDNRQYNGDIDFVRAVHATGRRKLIFCAMWAEVCMALTALDAALLFRRSQLPPVVAVIAAVLNFPTVVAHQTAPFSGLRPPPAIEVIELIAAVVALIPMGAGLGRVSELNASRRVTAGRMRRGCRYGERRDGPAQQVSRALRPA